MSDYTNYASFNTFTVQGRISYSDVKNGRNGEFLSVTIISTLVRDGAEMDVKFTDSDGLLRLFQAGYLRSGSQVTLTGRLQSVSETFTNKDGELQMRQRPLVEMAQVQIMTGGLGPIPKKDSASKSARNARRPVHMTPAAATQAAPVDEAPVAMNDQPDPAEVAALW